MSTHTEEDLAEWLKDRPESVKKLAEEFPPWLFVGFPLRHIGYTEHDALIFIERGVEDSVDNRIYICAKHLREGGELHCEHSENH